MQLQVQCFKRDDILIEEEDGKMIRIFPQWGKVWADKIVLTTRDRTITTIVRASEFPSAKKYYKRVSELLDSKQDYHVVNGIIPKKLSSCKKWVSA